MNPSTFQSKDELEFHDAPNSSKKPNTEVIASVANELKNIGDKLNESYNLPFVNKAKFAKALSCIVLENSMDIFVVFLKSQR